MKKGIVCFIVIFCCCGVCGAQQVVSAGGYNVKSDVSVNWILGGNLTGILAFDTVSLNKLQGSESEISLKVYPNPADDFINIEITPVDTGRLIIELYDNSGVKVLSKVTSYQQILQLNVSGILSGFYLLKVSFPGNTQMNSINKIIKK